MATLHTHPPRSSLYGGTSVQPPPKSMRTGARATRERISRERCGGVPVEDTPPAEKRRLVAVPCYFLGAGFLAGAFFAAGALRAAVFAAAADLAAGRFA